MEEPCFITLAEVLYLHDRSLELFGGQAGVGDLGLIESALGAARNAYWYGYADHFGIAAAYAFHLAEAQAFLDGNKRTAVAAAIAYLHSNGISVQPDNGRLYDAMIAIASKQLDKPGLAAVFRALAQPSKTP